jgi:hypothetical protein
MKYVLLFYAMPESAAEFAALPPDAKARRFDAVIAWLRDHRSQVVDFARLEPAPQAAHVVFGPNGAQPLITDGPYIEGKESVGGYVSVEVSSREEALALARSWPARGLVEVRPVVAPPPTAGS